MRNLDWDGVRNIRDFGGLATPLSSSGATRRGRIVRGPRRELLTDAGWTAAASWGLRSIVDLRNADEIGSRDGDPETNAPDAFVVTLAPTEDQRHPEFRAVCLPILDSPEYWQHNVRILPDLVRTALEAIAASKPGILVHCAAGRDRSGMISALLLANARVAADEIFEDYAESVRAMAGTTAHGGPTHDRQSAWSPEQVDGFLREVSHHVREFVTEADAVMDALRVSAATRRVLRELLTD